MEGQPQEQTYTQQQTTVVINNHGHSNGAPQNIKDWSTGLCGCMEDCGGCIFAYFMFSCYVCSLAQRMDESCCVPFVAGGLMAMRTKTRVMYGIKGSLCQDFCCTTYCPQLSACQIDRELKHCGI